MTEEKRVSLHETSVALCKVYEKLAQEGQVSFPLTREGVNKLDSVVKTVNASYFGFSRFPTDKEKAAAYFCLIIKDHVVTDGNKRLATIWLQICVDSFGLVLNPGMPLDVLAVSVEQEKELTLDELITAVRILLFESYKTGN